MVTGCKYVDIDVDKQMCNYSVINVQTVQLLHISAAKEQHEEMQPSTLLRL